MDKIISLQTNASVLDMLRKAGPRMNERSLPEMRGYLKRIGYEVFIDNGDFDETRDLNRMELFYCSRAILINSISSMLPAQKEKDLRVLWRNPS